MAFSQTAIQGVNPPIYSGGDLLVSWIGTLPAGQAWQVYLDQNLSWNGTTNRCRIPWPPAAVRIDIGSVPMADAMTSFSASLPRAPADKVELSWLGGTFLDPLGGDVAGFHVYGEAQPGGGIDFTSPLANITAYIGGIVTDGFGLGGFGLGGFGMSASSYSWKSGPLTSGTWHYAVIAYDSAGNEGAKAFWSGDVEVPPQPPAFFAGTMQRLQYTIVGFGGLPWGQGGFGAPAIQLNWNASPGG